MMRSFAVCALSAMLNDAVANNVAAMRSILFIVKNKFLINYAGDTEAHQCGYYHRYHAWHHETVVEKIFAYYSGPAAIEVDRGDIGWIVRDEEVPINAWQYAQ